MRKILQYIGIVIIAVPQILYYHFHYICKMAKHPEKYDVNYRFSIVKKYFSKIINLFHIDIKHYNLEEYETYKGKKLIVSNHLSVLDPLVYCMLVSRPFAPVAKKEVLSYPFIGKVLKVLGGFSLDRKNVMNQIGEIRNIVNFLKSDVDCDVLIFAEGTRNKHPEKHCLDLHAGSFKIAQMAKVPICSIVTFGSYRVFETKHYVKPYPVWVQFGKLQSVEEICSMPTQQLADLYKKFIDDRVDEFRVLDKEYIYKLKISTKRKALETIADLPVKS